MVEKDILFIYWHFILQVIDNFTFFKKNYFRLSKYKRKLAKKDRDSEKLKQMATQCGYINSSI